MPIPVPSSIRKALGHLGGTPPVAFVPLAVVAAYWAGNEVLLMLASLVLPALLATGQLGRTAQGRDAERDGLTGALTRAALVDDIAANLRTRRRSGLPTGVVVLDIDGFRGVALRHGGAVADMLLTQVATRITDHLRDGDRLGRVGGDAFAVSLAPTRHLDPGGLERIALRLQDAASGDYAIDNATISLTLSAGACLAGKACEPGADGLLQAAELAMETARAGGMGGLRLFSNRMKTQALARSELAMEIAEALENGQIRPWFQPQVSTDTGAVTGFEALARWEHPERGVLTPAVFLEPAAQAGLSERLSEVILFHALSAICAWDRAGHDVGSVGVNFSTEELRNPRLVEKIKWEVDRFDLAPERLTLEVLETVMCEDDDDTLARNIRALSRAGFGIDLDDFGTGHAAIANIRRFAVKRIKIDRGFIRGINTNDEQRLLVAAIVRMAESLGVEVLAEGVETLEEQSLVAQLGCGHIQGYGPARPMPFDDTLDWLGAHRLTLSRAASGAG